jgi:3-oxoacyl-[acyl-carrier protein] reductase
VTGVSREVGIGAAITRRLLAEGASVLASGWPAYDSEVGHSDVSADAYLFLIKELDPADGRLHYIPADLADAESPRRLVAKTVELFGAIDIVVANHARGSVEPLDRVTVAELDACWAVNARATLLLAQAFAMAHHAVMPGGRLILLTSGQHLRPMSGEIAYAVSKGAIQQMTLTLSDYMADKGVTVNCINPGPVDTKYASGELHRGIERGFPAGRWGQPEDVSRLVAWLASDESQWITGQTINSEGGWRGAKFHDDP